MLKKTIVFEDFDGNMTSETFEFNLTAAELTELELSEEGGFVESLEKLAKEQDGKKIIAVFKRLILLTYGRREGNRFVKSDALREEFEQSAAYSALFMELATNASEAALFLAGTVPRSMSDKVDTDALLTKVQDDINNRGTAVHQSVENVPAPVLQASEPVLAAPDPEPEVEDNRPAWEREDRDPNKHELQNMSKDEMVRAFQRKSQQG